MEYVVLQLPVARENNRQTHLCDRDTVTTPFFLSPLNILLPFTARTTSFGPFTLTATSNSTPGLPTPAFSANAQRAWSTGAHEARSTSASNFLWQFTSPHAISRMTLLSSGDSTVDKVRGTKSQGRLIPTVRKRICWRSLHPVRAYFSGWDSKVDMWTREEGRNKEGGSEKGYVLESGKVRLTRFGQFDT